ncbi:MAG: hypothetical protein ACRD5I_05530, partial [Candidatus Acidiferrales bacterium]
MKSKPLRVRARRASTQPRRREDNLTPGGKTHRRKRLRHLKVDMLPLDAQSLVAQGFTNGVPLRKISSQLRALGHNVGHHALSNYWHTVWHDVHDELRHARFLAEVVKAALHLDPSTPSHKTAKETLVTLFWHQLPELRRRKHDYLLREYREQEKVRGKNDDTTTTDSKPLSEDEINRRIRELYGLPP